MTVNDLYRFGVEALICNSIDDADFDARCLLEHCLDISTSSFFVLRDMLVESSIIAEYKKLIERRCKREPLQYIIGKWEFYSNSFYVGQGVLIPRPETEMLIDKAKEFLVDISKPVVVDFCSGSGCIAITIAKLFPESTVYAIEKYDQAYSFLLKNIELNSVKNVIPIKGDIFDKRVMSEVNPNLILSNPPYISSNVIDDLEDEVKAEPHTALDGGSDGYDFYRVLCDYWFSEYLKKGTAMMLECGEDQGDELYRMFFDKASIVEVINDYNGLQRIVTAYK